MDIYPKTQMNLLVKLKKPIATGHRFITIGTRDTAQTTLRIRLALQCLSNAITGQDSMEDRGAKPHVKLG